MDRCHNFGFPVCVFFLPIVWAMMESADRSFAPAPARCVTLPIGRSRGVSNLRVVLELIKDLHRHSCISVGVPDPRWQLSLLKVAG